MVSGEVVCGTRDAIAAMSVLCDRSLEHNNKVYVCYVDYEKAFDRVNWDKLMTSARNGYPGTRFNTRYPGTR